eukprot:300275_1
MSLKAAIPSSVNIKWLEEWDVVDALKWIKLLQDRELIEGSNTMSTIIRQEQYSGRDLIKCVKQDSLIKLFKGKITKKTARILQDQLNMERQMCMKRKQSQLDIRQGKWTPRLFEKIRCVDDRYKNVRPRSYPATIKKVLKNEIMVCYDGYPDEQGELVHKSKWAGKITILEKIKRNAPNKAPPNAPNRAQSQINALNNQNDPNRNLPKRKSVPPKDVQFVPPFQNKRVEDWSIDDVGDWVESVKINAAGPNVQKNMQKDKEKFKNAIVANEVTGKRLKKYKNGQKLHQNFKQYTINEAFCNIMSEQLRNILQSQEVYMQSDSSFSNKNIVTWSSEDLQAWVKSLNLQHGQRIITAIKQAEYTGSDFSESTSGKEIADGLQIEESIGQLLFRE